MVSTLDTITKSILALLVIVFIFGSSSASTNTANIICNSKLGIVCPPPFIYTSYTSLYWNTFANSHQLFTILLIVILITCKYNNVSLINVFNDLFTWRYAFMILFYIMNVLFPSGLSVITITDILCDHLENNQNIFANITCRQEWPYGSFDNTYSLVKNIYSLIVVTLLLRVSSVLHDYFDTRKKTNPRNIDYCLNYIIVSMCIAYETYISLAALTTITVLCDPQIEQITSIICPHNDIFGSYLMLYNIVYYITYSLFIGSIIVCISIFVFEIVVCVKRYNLTRVQMIHEIFHTIISSIFYTLILIVVFIEGISLITINEIICDQYNKTGEKCYNIWIFGSYDYAYYGMVVVGILMLVISLARIIIKIVEINSIIYNKKEGYDKIESDYELNINSV